MSAIYQRIGVKNGMRKNLYGDTFIMMDSIGLLNRGHTTGYLHCADSSSGSADRYPPCILNLNTGTQVYSDESRQDVFAFQRLDGQWFAYSEGPN